MSVLLHVSDPHFGSERPEVVTALLALAHTLAPDLLILSGDITQRARAEQFRAAASFVQQLGIARTLTIPGNHDIALYDLASRVGNPYGNYRKSFGDELQPSAERPDYLALTVKTTRRYRHVDGEISAEQREAIAARLERAQPTQLRLVILHQPVAVPRPAEQHNVCHGSEQAVRRWAQAGADLILAGHIHLPFVLPLHETFAGLPRQVWAVNAGTALSSRVRYDAGNSVNVLRTGAAGYPRECTLEDWRYTAAGSAFVRASELKLSFS